MPKIPQYEGNFLKAEDIPLGKIATANVKSVELPNTVVCKNKRKIPHPVMYFDGREKGLVMNKSHYNVMKHLYGPDTDAWIGKPVLLMRRHLRKSFGEYNVACVRIVPPQGESIRRGLSESLGVAQPYTEAQIEEFKQEDSKGGHN